MRRNIYRFLPVILFSILTLIFCGCEKQEPTASICELKEVEQAKAADTNTVADTNMVHEFVVAGQKAQFRSGQLVPEPEDSNHFVMWVNSEGITRDEFRLFMMRKRAMTYSYYKTKYDVNDSKEFWTTSFDGETPLERIKSQTKDEMVKIKVQQILARDRGVIDYVNYDTMQQRREVENKRRKEAVARKQVIYGPIQYNEPVYFNYIFSNMIIRLKEKLGLADFALEEGDLRAIYEADKDEKYQKRDEIKVNKIEIEFKRFGEEGLTEKEARAKITEAKNRLDAGEDFNTVAKDYNAGGEVEQHLFDEDSAHSDERIFYNLNNTARELKVGQVSDIITEEETDHYYIIKCAEINDAGYLPFEEMSGIVKKWHVDKKYDELVAKLVAEADVEINEKVYNEIVVRN